MTETDMLANGNATRLPHRVAVYVPTLTETGDRIRDRERLLHDVRERLTSLCGGTTTTQTVGTFLADDGRIVTESVSVVVAACADLVPVLPRFWDIAQTVKTDGRQTAVSVEIDSAMYLIH